ncbi:hypothetical protein ACP70R_049045 [Stipagrostis hirtigluma subsp. patula]
MEQGGSKHHVQPRELPANDPTPLFPLDYGMLESNITNNFWPSFTLEDFEAFLSEEYPREATIQEGALPSTTIHANRAVDPDADSMRGAKSDSDLFDMIRSLSTTDEAGPITALGHPVDGLTQPADTVREHEEDQPGPSALRGDQPTKTTTATTPACELDDLLIKTKLMQCNQSVAQIHQACDAMNMACDAMNMAIQQLMDLDVEPSEVDCAREPTQHVTEQNTSINQRGDATNAYTSQTLPQNNCFVTGIIPVRNTPTADKRTQRKLLPKPAMTESILAATWILRLAPAKELCRQGTKIKDVLLEPKALDGTLVSAMVRLLRETEYQTSHYRSTKNQRHYVSPNSYVASSDTDEEISVQYFKNSTTPYDIALCKMVVVPVLMEQGWSAYAVDLEHRVISIMDPFFMEASGNAPRPPHDCAAHLILRETVKCMYNITHDQSLLEGGWSIHIHVVGEPKCMPHDTAIYALYCHRWFEGRPKDQEPMDVSGFVFDELQSKQARRDLAFQLIHMNENKGYVPEALSRGIRACVPASRALLGSANQ